MSRKFNTESFFCISGKAEEEDKQYKQKMRKLESMASLTMRFY